MGWWGGGGAYGSSNKDLGRAQAKGIMHDVSTVRQAAGQMGAASPPTTHPPTHLCAMTITVRPSVRIARSSADCTAASLSAGEGDHSGVTAGSQRGHSRVGRRDEHGGPACCAPWAGCVSHAAGPRPHLLSPCPHLLPGRHRQRISRSSPASSADVASSRMSSGGSRTSARAMAMRWRWPPDSSLSVTGVAYPWRVRRRGSSWARYMPVTEPPAGAAHSRRDLCVPRACRRRQPAPEAAPR